MSQPKKDSGHCIPVMTDSTPRKVTTFDRGQHHLDWANRSPVSLTNDTETLCTDQCSSNNSHPATTSTNRHDPLSVVTGSESLPDQMNMSACDTVTHNAIDTHDEEDNEEEIIFSVVWCGGKLGVAHYNINTTEIYLMPDTAETENLMVLSKVLRQIRPSCVVTSAKEDERLLKAIKDIVEKDCGTEMDARFIQVLPSIDYSIETSKQRILNMNLPSIPTDFNDTERMLHLGSLIPFTNTCMIRALGGLLKFVEKNRVGIELEDVNMRIPILSIKMFSLEDLLFMDEQSYSALQIFRTAFHPSLKKISYREDVSLFRLLNRCSSKAGSKLLRLWFLQPLKNIDRLRERHNAVEFFAGQRHIEIALSLQKCLRQIKDTKRILARMRMAQASIGDWQTLYKTVYGAVYIADVCRTQAPSLPLLQKIKEVFTNDLHKIASLISRIVDFDESAMQNRFVVKPNVDPKLDEKKRLYQGLPDFMTAVAREELAHLTEEINHCNVLYLPQLGYLLSIPVTDAMKKSQNYDIPGLEFVFISNNVVHYKSARTRELDQMLGDTQCDITDYETDIMHKLQNIILEHSTLLIDVVQYAAELDCILALATSAKEFNYVKPELTSEDIIQIKGGRHPIQEACCNITFVPNDTFSGGEYSRMKILTGPNASGKSVYLKQVALIVYMAQIGSFVPAEKSLIGLVDGIYTRVSTTESVSIGLSAFMIDLNQVSGAVNMATRHSLVLLDEFGKGTETADGLALLSACLQYWLNKEENCPHIFVSTHFANIVSGDLLTRSKYLTYQTLAVLQDENELVFLYQLEDGHTDTSYACHVASQAGLPMEIVKRGAEVSRLLKDSQPIHRVDNVSTATQYKRCEAIVNRFLDLDLETDDVQHFLKEFVIPVYQGTIKP